MAAVNFVINILWKEGSEPSGRENRKKILKDLDTENKLQEILKNNEDQELSEKANQALTFFGD